MTKKLVIRDANPNKKFTEASKQKPCTLLCLRAFRTYGQLYLKGQVACKRNSHLWIQWLLMWLSSIFH